MGAARIVDEDIKRTECGDRRLDDQLRRTGRRHIDRNRRDMGAGPLAQLGLGLLQPGGLPRRDDDGCAIGQQFVGNHKADAGAGPAAQHGTPADGGLVAAAAEQVQQPGDDDVLRKIRGDLDAAGVAQTDAEIRRTMDDLMAEAVAQIEAAG